MTTKLQEFLRNGGSFDRLKERYSLRVKQHGKFPQLWQFKYDQIDSPMGDPLVAECRGIILDQNDNWAVVARPFDKFFNHTEGLAAKIDWSTAQITEKLDGSLIILYHYNDEWHVATSGTPDASGEVNGFGMTFAQLFWDVFAQSGMKLSDLDPYDSNYTFMFELTTPFNRIVVPHKASKATLIGIRNRNNGKEISPSFGPKGWPHVIATAISSEAEVLATFERMAAINQEGWVVVDEDFNRCKMKHPQYITLHHMRGEGSPSPKRALEVVLAGEHEEVLTYWPEWKPLFREVNSRLFDLTIHLLDFYTRIWKIPVQKDFALEAIKSRCSGALFALRAGKTPSFRAYLANMNVDNLAATLKLDDIRPDIITASIQEAA